MAEHAGIVTRGRPLQPILDTLGVIRERNARFELLETIIPVAIVETPGTAREVVSRRYNGFTLEAAVAGERSELQIFNPLSSGVLVRVRSALFSSRGSGDVLLNTTSVALATLSSADQGAMDFRVPGIGAAQLRTDSGVLGTAPGFQKLVHRHDGGTGWSGAHEIKVAGYVLTEGSGIIIISPLDAFQSTCEWEWDEESITTLTQ